jgi:hypothetical protein
MSMPSFKKLKTNDWHEYDGLEVDLSSPTFESRTFSMKTISSKSGYDSLIALMKSSVYHTIELSGTGISFGSCRLKDVSVLNIYYGDYNVTTHTCPVKSIESALSIVCDEHPFYNFTPSVPVAPERMSGYLIDTNAVMLFGVRFLDKTMDDVIKPGLVKLAVNRNIDIMDCMEYDQGDTIKIASRDITIKCFLKGSTPIDAYNKYRNFMAYVSRPNVRTLAYPQYSISLTCYYKSSTVTEYMPSEGGGVTGIFFTLKLKKI